MTKKGLRSAGGPKLLNWGLSGQGSNLLKSDRPLTSTTPRVSPGLRGARWGARGETPYREGYLPSSFSPCVSQAQSKEGAEANATKRSVYN